MLSRAAGKARVGFSLAQPAPPLQPRPALALSLALWRTNHGPGIGDKGDASGACAAAALLVTGVCYKMGVLIVLTVLWLFSSVKADSKAITTSLTTKWFSTPLLLEASEFLAEDSQEKFWNFVEASQNIGSSDHHDSS